MQNFFNCVKKRLVLVAVFLIGCFGSVLAQNVAKIGDTHYTTLNAAAAAVPAGTPTTITILQNLNFYDIAQSNIQNKTITFTGTPTDTLTLTNAAHPQTNASGADLTFENITLKNDNTADVYRGIIHVNKVTINNSEIIGFMMGYATQFTCNNCTFTASCKFHMWTYGSNCTFNNCTFNSSYSSSGGKAVNVYTDQTYDQRVIEFNNCEFNATNHSGNGSAIQINSESTCFVIYVNNCTVTGYSNTEATAVPGYENLANNKSSSTKTTLYIDGVQILKQGSCDPAAKINDTYYNTLQAAVEDAYDNMTGDVTIELLRNTTENVVVCQQRGLELTINGSNDTLTGQIVVNGINVTTTGGGDISASSLDIINLNFKNSPDMWTSYFVDVPTNSTSASWHVCDPSRTNGYNDAHNVTVKNCTFDGGGSSNGIASVHVASNTNNVRNIVVDSCTVSNAHSLIQIQGGTNGLVVTNCKGINDVHNGINITGGSSSFIIMNDTLNVDGYGIRIRNQSTHAAICKLADNLIDAPTEGIILSGNTNTGDTIYIMSGTYNGPISDSDSPTNLSITGGTFSEAVATVQSKCAPGYMAVDNDPDDEHCTVYPSYVAVYEANGGTGTMMNDTVPANHPDITVKECGFTREGYAFVRWNTKADGMGVNFTPGSPLTLTQDTTLYAQWGRVLNATQGTIYEELQAAIDAATAGDSIVMLTDLTSSAVISVVKNLIINGNNHTVTTTASRGLWTDAAGVNLTLRNFNLNGGTATNRGIQVNDPNVTIVMDSCRIIMQDANYAILAIEKDLSNNPNVNLHMTVTNSYIKGLAALRSFAPEANFTFVNDTLHGVNPYNNCPSSGNNFAVIMLCGDEAYGDGLGSENSDISFENCVIIAEEQGNCSELWIGVVDGASQVAATIDASTKIIDESSENVQEGIIIEGPGNTITLPLDVAARDSILNNPYLTLTDNGNGTYTVSASVFYYWSTSGVYCDFHSPFTENWLAADESIDILENVTMTQDVTADIDGNFNLNFKDASNTYTITQDDYHIMLADNATATTDVQVPDLFSSLSGSSIIETDNEDDTYTYSVAPYYVITYYSNNSATDTVVQVRPYGETVYLKDYTTFDHADSTIYRWNTQADGNGTDYALGAAYSEDSDIELYAVWRLNLDMTMSSTDVVCYGENNGTDTVKIIGGDTPFQLVLSGTALSENDTVRNIMDRTYIFENLKPGDYTVTLTDVLGKDTITGNFTIDQPDTLVATFTSVPYAPCPLMGEGEYAVSMTTTGGNGGNVIAWGGDAVDVNDLSTIVTSEADDRDRTYNITVTVTDQKGCTAVIDTSFTVSPVIANDETVHSNTIMTIDTINQSILYGCDTVIRDFGTPSFTFTNAAITEAILDTVYNNVSTAFPDSIFTLGENKIIWTAVDTCGHEITAEQVVNITHKPCPSAFDYHGIEYPAVRIGCDCWTTKNLASTQYSPDGEMIPDVRSYPINTRASVYGNLYTYEAAMHGADVAAAVASNTPVQGACPEGWHVPSQAEVEALMASAEVQALMSQGTWIPDNGTNSTGFDMLPGGFYNSARDRYERMYVSAYIWIATPVTAIYHACEFGAACSSMELIPGNLSDGYSIRCVITDPNE